MMSASSQIPTNAWPQDHRQFSGEWCEVKLVNPAVGIEGIPSTHAFITEGEEMQKLVVSPYSSLRFIEAAAPTMCRPIPGGSSPKSDFAFRGRDTKGGERVDSRHFLR